MQHVPDSSKYNHILDVWDAIVLSVATAQCSMGQQYVPLAELEFLNFRGKTFEDHQVNTQGTSDEATKCLATALLMVATIKLGLGVTGM